MRVLVLGGDGYLGWPTSLYLSRNGHEVALVDNFAKRRWENETHVTPLFSIPSLRQRLSAWHEVSEIELMSFIGDLQDYRFVESTFRNFQPQAVVHYGEQPSAGYSMLGRDQAVGTQVNNMVGNLNIVFAMRDMCPDAHLVKVGALGEYGTSGVDIEGMYGEHARQRLGHASVPEAARPLYQLSKVHDTQNIHFACRTWGMRATDLRHGVVYGVETDETRLDERLATSFHYDDVFGTALNRFCVQAVLGYPLTVYGSGRQTRSFLNVIDTVRCVELAILNPADPGEFRVFNQFTELFSTIDLARTVKQAATAVGLSVGIANVPNPRVDAEDHCYNVERTCLVDAGLTPRLLSETLVDSMLRKIERYRNRIDTSLIPPHASCSHHGLAGSTSTF